jgi:hypothetical protein
MEDKRLNAICEEIEKFYESNGHSPDVYDKEDDGEKTIVVSNGWDTDRYGWASSYMEVNIETGKGTLTIEYEYGDVDIDEEITIDLSGEDLESIAEDFYENENESAMGVEY